MTASEGTRLEAVRRQFESAGGHFACDIGELAERFAGCRALVFDWDGVWNDGRKGPTTPSDFAEADSMGLNMLRYGLWRRSGELPLVAIISGENNEGARRFADREHLDNIYTGIADKRRVIEQICRRDGLDGAEISCVFDDINDLPMAGACGLRLMVRREASPLLANYVVERGLCDYRTGNAEYAVRECCELLLGLMGNGDEVLDSRIAFDADYQRYFSARQAVATRSFTIEDGEMVEHSQDSTGGR